MDSHTFVEEDYRRLISTNDIFQNTDWDKNQLHELKFVKSFMNFYLQIYNRHSESLGKKE